MYEYIEEEKALDLKGKAEEEEEEEDKRIIFQDYTTESLP